MVVCLERGADLHMAQLMPLPLTISCFSKIQIGLTFLVPAHPGSPGQRAVKRVCVCGNRAGTPRKRTTCPESNGPAQCTTCRVSSNTVERWAFSTIMLKMLYFDFN